MYQATIHLIKTLGHEVIRAKDIGLQRASDEELLHRASEEHCVLITRDKGFGALVFLLQLDHDGVILLRTEPATIHTVHDELARFLRAHAGETFGNRFIVIEPGRHRIRTSK